MRSKIIVLIVLVLLASGIGTVSAFSNSGDGDWKYYKKITVKEKSGKSLTDFQVLVELNPADFPAKAKSDGSDLRFEGASGKELCYWIENWNYPNNANIWVKVPSIPANGETKIKMYYGNRSASAVSDGDMVFEFFDDFEDEDFINNPTWRKVRGSDASITTIDGDHWIKLFRIGNLDIPAYKASGTFDLSQSFVITYKLRLSSGDQTGGGLALGTNDGYVLYNIGLNTGHWNAAETGPNSWSSGFGYDTSKTQTFATFCVEIFEKYFYFASDNTGLSRNTNHNIKLIYTASNHKWKLFVNGEDKGDIIGSTNYDRDISEIHISGKSATSPGNGAYFDDIIVRKYTSSEPTTIKFSPEYPTKAPTPTPPIPNFTPYSNNPLLTSYTVQPYSLFKLSDDEYHMFFVEQRESGDYPADFNADLLISTDGLTWDDSSIHRNVISDQQSGHTFNYYVAVIKGDDIYRAWHSATSDWNIAGTKLYYSTSKDGVHYSGHGMVLDNEPYPEYDSRNINYPWIVFDGNTYHLYYGAYPGHQSGSPDRSYHWTIAYATSSDGTHWKKQGVVVDPGMSPAVVYDGTKFEMLYNVQNGDEEVVKYAVSYDGLNWEEIGDVDSIDGWVVGLAKENGVYQVWYRKKTETGQYELCYATATYPTPAPTVTPTITPTPLSGKTKAVWLYNPEKYDTSTLMPDLKSAGINTIFLSTDVNNIWKYERFVKSAHENGIEVHAMILEDPRCALTENHESSIKAVETILDYNGKSLAKFDGIDIDTEPYVDLDLEHVWQDYITLLEAIHEKTTGKTVLSADIPRWYDEAKIKDLAPNVDFFVIMAYDSGGAGWNTASEIEDAVASELGAIRGEDSKAVIGIGVHEGFEDKEAVERCIEDLYNYYLNDPAFHGVSIFKYETYSGLVGAPEVTVPTGEEVTPKPPGFEVIFAIAGLLLVAYLLRRGKRR